jgi:hypothetical protein
MERCHFAIETDVLKHPKAEGIIRKRIRSQAAGMRRELKSPPQEKWQGRVHKRNGKRVVEGGCLKSQPYCKVNISGVKSKINERHVTTSLSTTVQLTSNAFRKRAQQTTA